MVDLLYVADIFEKAIPANLTTQPAIVLVERQPNKERLTHNMVFWNEAPETGIGRIVSIVTHHPVVVHLEGVAIRLTAVDIDFPIANFQRVTFVDTDAAFIERQRLERQQFGGSALRNPNRTVV